MEGAEASAVGPAPFSLEPGMERPGWRDRAGSGQRASHTSPARRAGRLCRRGRGWGMRRGRKGQDCDRGRVGGWPLAIWLGQGQILQLLNPQEPAVDKIVVGRAARGICCLGPGRWGTCFWGPTLPGPLSWTKPPHLSW